MRSDSAITKHGVLILAVFLLGAVVSVAMPAFGVAPDSGLLAFGVIGVPALIAGRRFKLTIPNVSLLLWVILLTHRAFVLRFESVNTTEQLVWSPSLLVEVVITIAVFAVTVMLFLYRFLALPAPRLPITLKLLLAYTAFAGISLIYTPSVTYTGFWFLRLAAAVLLMTVYFTSAGARGIGPFVGWTLFSIVPYLVTVWIAFLRGDGLWGERIQGYWIHPGQASIIAFAVALAYFLQCVLGNGKKRHIALSLLCFGAAFLSGGKTAALAAALVLAAVFLLTWRRWISVKGLLALGGFLVCVAMLATLEVGLVAHVERYRTGEFSSVQTRFNMWEGALAMWRQAPLLGQGFAATRVTRVAMWNFGNRTGHVHNSFLETLVGVGLLGSAPLFLAIGVVLFRLSRAPLNTMISFHLLIPAAAAWLVLLLSGLGDLVFGGTLQPSAYLFLGLMVSVDVITMHLGSSMAVARPKTVPYGRVATKKVTPVGVTT